MYLKELWSDASIAFTLSFYGDEIRMNTVIFKENSETTHWHELRAPTITKYGLI
jgi:hypothetical protein